MAEIVVIGSGPNGLVAANYLADAGHQVLVLETQRNFGGAVSSDRGVHPDFVHDVSSTFHPLAAASPIISALELTDYGLVRKKAPAVLGNPTLTGGWALQSEDPYETAAYFEAQAPGDGELILQLWRHWETAGQDIVHALVSPFPAQANVKNLLMARGHRGFLATLALPLDQLLKRFRGPGFPLLLAGNAGHADMSHRLPGSGLMALVLTMLGHQSGFVVPEGGAQGLSDALVRRLRTRGGEVRTNAQVVHIEVNSGSVSAVHLLNGERVAADAVLAGVSAPALYTELLDPAVVPERIKRAMRRFSWDPGTVRVDWALAAPIPWREVPHANPGTIHLADSAEQICANADAIQQGVVPAQPFIVAGQMTTTDPSRSPAGTESVSAYTRVPQRFGSDAGGVLSGRWDAQDLERFAERIEQRFERFAPGFTERVIARRVWGPHELEARNANLVNGAIGGGTQRLRNQLIFRPFLGKAGALTPVSGLFLASASAHPGGGVHGGPGHSAAISAISFLATRA